jgi:hypothetical protein
MLVAVVAVSSALAAGRSSSFTVTSSLDGRTVLQLRIPWIARLHHISPLNVAEVDYYIDGKKAWDEHHPPYYYGGYSGQLPSDAPTFNGGNALVTAFLKPGLHTFTVRAISFSGTAATDTVKARVVAAPPPPSQLAGTWTRTVSPDDLKKGPPGPPAGPWTLHITSVGWGWSTKDRFQVQYLPNNAVVLGPEVVTPAQQSGGFCGVDPPHEWTLALSTDGTSMQLNPVGTDACGDRLAILQGIWTRTP